MNEAMKMGVARILDEEDSFPTHIATADTPKTSSFADMWNLALSCATGGPLDDYDPPPSTSRQFQWKSHEPTPVKKGASALLMHRIVSNSFILWHCVCFRRNNGVRKI